MAYYTALIAAWNSATQPPTGVTGTGLTGLTTANKLIAINGWTVSNVPASTWYASAQQCWQCIVLAEFTALLQATRMEIYALLNMPFPRQGGATSANGQIAVLMPQSTCPLTYANFVALAQTVAGTSSWWQASVANGGGGLSSPVGPSDLVAAGNLT
jgi:hypothetical protein